MPAGSDSIPVSGASGPDAPDSGDVASPLGACCPAEPASSPGSAASPSGGGTESAPDTDSCAPRDPSAAPADASIESPGSAAEPGLSSIPTGDATGTTSASLGVTRLIRLRLRLRRTWVDRTSSRAACTASRVPKPLCRRSRSIRARRRETSSPGTKSLSPCNATPILRSSVNSIRDETRKSLASSNTRIPLDFLPGWLPWPGYRTPSTPFPGCLIRLCAVRPQDLRVARLPRPRSRSVRRSARRSGLPHR